MTKPKGRDEDYIKWKFKNPQRNNSEGKEAGDQINNLEHKEEINQNRMKKQEFKKMRRV